MTSGMDLDPTLDPTLKSADLAIEAQALVGIFAERGIDISSQRASSLVAAATRLAASTQRLSRYDGDTTLLARLALPENAATVDLLPVTGTGPQ